MSGIMCCVMVGYLFQKLSMVVRSQQPRRRSRGTTRRGGSSSGGSARSSCVSNKELREQTANIVHWRKKLMFVPEKSILFCTTPKVGSSYWNNLLIRERTGIG